MKWVMTPAEAIRRGQEQAEALAALPETIVILNRSLRSFAATVARLDRLVQRIDRLTEPLEEPLTALAPRLQALVPLLDEELLASLPELLATVQRTGMPALELLGQTQDQVASIAASVDRLMGVMDGAVGRVQDLPGAMLVTRRLRSGTPRGATEPKKEGPSAPG